MILQILGFLFLAETFFCFLGLLLSKIPKLHKYGIILYSFSAFADNIHEKCCEANCAKCSIRDCIRCPLHKHKRMSK